jgi:hypothetical protein
MLLNESYKNRLKKLAGLLTEASADAFVASDSRVPFNPDLMRQAIEQGREIGILYKGDEMKAPSGKYRLIYPVAMGTSKAGNKVIRAIHKEGQSESVANRTGIRSSEAQNVWRLFKADNIKGMWFTGNFFRGPLNQYNPNDRGMVTVDVSADLRKIEKYQNDLLLKQKEEGEKLSRLKSFKEKGERPLEQPIENPETRIGNEPENEPEN